MTMQKGNLELQVSQLSDGEKCLLALVGDLARRLAIANPNQANPCDGQGIVLIDEIELHLHPRWQREVIPKLEQTFPGCQFIISTHSPQVLSDVRAGAVVLLELDTSSNIVVTKRAKSTFGHDSNYILETILGVTERPQELENKIRELFVMIDDGDLKGAKILREEIATVWNRDLPSLTRADVAIRRRESVKK